MLTRPIRPMLAYSSEVFDSEEFLYEPKWDGTRCILFWDGVNIRLQNRRLINITGRYPEFRDVRKWFRAKNTILDGEIVVLKDGRPDFSRLQQREHLVGEFKIEAYSHRIPAAFICFDVLFWDGKTLLNRPLDERREALSTMIFPNPYLLVSQSIYGKGTLYFHEAIKLGFEGIMAKNRTSPYLMGKRSRYWLKIKPRFVEECLIVGFVEREGEIRSLAIAQYHEGRLEYRGRVSSGLSTRQREELAKLLKPLRRETAPVEGGKADIQWVEPGVRCKVSYFERTREGSFRAPVLMGVG